MSANISEICNVSHAMPYQAISNTAINSTVFSMANYDRIQFAVTGGVIAGTLTAQIMQCIDTNVANMAAITGAPANITITTNTTKLIEVRDTLLDTANANCFVAIRVTGATSVCNASATALRTYARLKQATLLG